MTKPQDLKAGDRIEVDYVTNPEDPNDGVSRYDEVVHIDPVGPAYHVYTTTQDFLVTEDTDINMEE